MIFTDPSQVPPPPETGLWSDTLRWLVAVIDDENEIMPFVTSVLSYCYANNGITKKQGEGISRILKRVRSEWMAGILDCQYIEDDTEEETGDTDSQEVRTLQ